MRTWVAISLCIMFAAPALAQVSEGDKFLILGGGYATGQIKSTGETVEGAGFGLSIEQRGIGHKFSLAATFGYMRLDPKSNDTAVSKQYATSFPLFVGFKFWLSESKIQPFAGLLVGVHFAQLNRVSVVSGESYPEVSTSGYGMNIPLGVALSVSDEMFINIGYTFNWLWDSGVFKDDMLHFVNAGLGFELN